MPKPPGPPPHVDAERPPLPRRKRVRPTDSPGRPRFHLRNVLERPDSPREKNDVLPEEEEQESAVLLLQRIIRGRSREA